MERMRSYATHNQSLNLDLNLGTAHIRSKRASLHAPSQSRLPHTIPSTKKDTKFTLYHSQLVAKRRYRSGQHSHSQ